MKNSDVQSKPAILGLVLDASELFGGSSMGDQILKAEHLRLSKPLLSLITSCFYEIVETLSFVSPQII